MRDVMARAPWFVIAVALCLAATWALRVPFFQEPDELAHIDYALELYAVGKPFKVMQAHPARISSATLRYMLTSVRYRENRYNPVGELPAGYGTAPYFARIDANAPGPDPRVPQAGSAMPYVMFAYPAGYYILAAAAMKLAAIVHPHSIVGQFFAARFTGVACLAFTLALAYGIFLRLRIERPAALLATAAVGWLPLTSWVSGYVQPDDLTTLLLTAGVYLALRWKGEPEQNRWPALLSATLVCLAFVKQHYALAAIAATFGAGLSTVRTRRGFVLLACTFVPPLFALGAALWFVPVERTGALHFAGQRPGTPLVNVWSPADLLSYVVNGIHSIYLGGDAFMEFWMRFGIRGATVYRGAARQAIVDVLVACTLLIACALLLRTWSVMRRLALVARRRSVVRAAQLFFGNPIVNVYVLVTLIMSGVYVESRGNMWLEGRYWLPVIVPTVALAVAIAPRLFHGRVRRKTAFVIAASWALYAGVSAPFALAALDRNFYHQPMQTLKNEPYARILDVTPQGACATTPAATLSVLRGCKLALSGYALDSERGLPAREVYLTVDGRQAIRATTMTPSPLVRDVYGDDELADSGFTATLDTATLGAGRHAIGLDVVERRAPRGLAGPDEVSFEVRAP
jgi:hypothetical protein